MKKKKQKETESSKKEKTEMNDENLSRHCENVDCRTSVRQSFTRFSHDHVDIDEQHEYLQNAVREKAKPGCVGEIGGRASILGLAGLSLS